MGRLGTAAGWLGTAGTAGTAVGQLGRLGRQGWHISHGACQWGASIEALGASCVPTHTRWRPPSRLTRVRRGVVAAPEGAVSLY